VGLRAVVTGAEYERSAARVRASEPFLFSARGHSEAGVYELRFYVDGEIVSSVPGDGSSLVDGFARVDTTVLAPGLHTLRAVAWGTDGGRSSVDLWLEVAPAGGGPCAGDSTSPVVNLTAPPAGATVNEGLVVLRAGANDSSGVAVVEFFANDRRVATDSAAPFSASWSALSGDWLLEARALDACGNESWSTAQVLHVLGPCSGDSIVQSVALSSPVAGSTIDGGCPVQVEASATDPNGVLRVEFLVNGTLSTVDQHAPYSMTYWTAGTGSLVFEARALDGCGNLTSSAPVTVFVDGTGAPCDCDNEAPAAVLVAPPNGTVVPRSGVDLVVDADDNLVVSFVHFEITGEASNPVLLQGPPWTYRFVPNANAAGAYSIRTRAVDVCGHFSAWSPNVSLTATNQLPTPGNDTASVRRDSVLILDVTANDTDPDGDTVVIGGGSQGGVAQPPLHGTAVRLDANRFSYTPIAGFIGSDSFVYRAHDGFGGLRAATVSVTVLP
jgi:hypothetical protein